jgi:uncharacterized protein
LSKTKIFFVTDVHGSDRCFRKFVNAGKFYGVNVLILGGDITGKMIVPIVDQEDGTRVCNYIGATRVLKSQQEVDEMVKMVKDSGYYPYLSGKKEVEELVAQPDKVHQLFGELMKKDVERWMALAEERLKGTGIKCYVSPGNDDFFDIDEALDSATYVINPEEKVVDIDGEHEMITLGYTNHTPWNSPREVDESVLEEKIEKMASGIKNMNTAIFNIHVPPIDTQLDQAPKLGDNLKPVTAGGHPVMTSAGSTAVRSSIEKHQPLAGLHGHVHESRGIVKIGRTMCFNPGSEYNQGILRGLICELDKDKVKSHVLTSG